MVQTYQDLHVYFLVMRPGSLAVVTFDDLWIMRCRTKTKSGAWLKNYIKITSAWSIPKMRTSKYNVNSIRIVRQSKCISNMLQVPCECNANWRFHFQHAANTMLIPRKFLCIYTYITVWVKINNSNSNPQHPGNSSVLLLRCARQIQAVTTRTGLKETAVSWPSQWIGVISPRHCRCKDQYTEATDTPRHYRHLAEGAWGITGHIFCIPLGMSQYLRNIKAKGSKGPLQLAAKPKVCRRLVSFFLPWFKLMFRAKCPCLWGLDPRSCCFFYCMFAKSQNLMYLRLKTQHSWCLELSFHGWLRREHPWKSC